MTGHPRSHHDTDVLLIGAGPVGLFGAYYAGFRGLRVTVMDSLPEVGGQISAMYPEKALHDIAGFPTVTGRTLVENLATQAGRYQPHYLLGRQATNLQVDTTAQGATRPITVTTDLGERITAGAVVITGGIGTFIPRPLPVGAEYEGRGLAYFVPEPHTYAGADVVIVGSGDSAFDWAGLLHPIARSVTLVHRREAFRAHAATVAAVRDAGIPIITNARITAVSGTDHLDTVTVSIDGQPEDQTLACDRLVAALGFTANLGPIRQWGLCLRNNRNIDVDSAMRTNIPGVFAAGDIVDYDGKVRLIAVGFGEVATAVNHAVVHIDPSQKVFPGHSTDADQPQFDVMPA